MNSSNQMTRWTNPTNPAFYALHKNAIGIFQMVGVIVQLIWLFFSTRPLAEMLIDSVPTISFNYALTASFVCLAFLHYMIHELVRYIFFNIMDNDPNTNNSIGSMGAFMVIVGAMLLLDIKGVTNFIRDENKFTTLHTQNETQANEASQKRIDNFNADLNTINTAFNTELEAIRAQYALKIAKASRVKTYDESDVRRKNATIANIKAERESAISIKKTELATAQRALVDAKNSDLAVLNKKHNAITGKIENADGENETKAHSYGWIVSIFCLITLLFCTYQSTDLRVKSGQQPVSRYTIADATGSTTTKFFDVITDAWQRQSHRFLVFFHGILTTGTQELDELDGAFNLKKKAKSSVDLGGNNGNGENGGNGGENKHPTPPPTSPAQPLGGSNVHSANKRFEYYDGDDKMIIAEELSKFTGYSNRVCMSFLIGNNPFVELIKDPSDNKALFSVDNIIENIHTYEKSVHGKNVIPTPSVKEVVESVITDITPVITEESQNTDDDTKMLIDAFRKGIQELNSECSNYASKNGDRERVVNRIGEKLINLYNFSQAHKNIIPDNVFRNFSKAYERARAIIEAYKEGMKP